MKNFYDLVKKEDFWVNLWQEIVGNTIVLKTQWSETQKWKQFYDTVGSLFSALWGNAEKLGEEMACFMAREGIIVETDRVLDVGCGTGWLSVALAPFVLSVTALDYSSKMVNYLNTVIKKQEISNIHVVHDDFYNFTPDEPFDTVIAAFFPQAISPDGILKLEQWARKQCVLVLQYSSRGMPVRQRLFEHLIGQAPPSPGLSLLLWCFGYLIAMGKCPEIRKYHWESEIAMTANDMLEFYKSYFAIFGFDEDTVKEAFYRVGISNTNTMLSCDLAILWWDK